MSLKCLRNFLETISLPAEFREKKSILRMKYHGMHSPFFISSFNNELMEKLNPIYFREFI